MIEIRQSRVFRGPSVWARIPVVHLSVDTGDPAHHLSNVVPGLTGRLLTLVPGLRDHACSRGHAGGFEAYLHEGTSASHVLEHLAIELQCLTGADVRRGKTRASPRQGVDDVIFEYRHEDVGIAAAQLACRLVNHLIDASEPAFSFPEGLERLVQLAARLSYGPSTAAIVDAAERHGIPVLRLDPHSSLVQLGHGCYQHRIRATTTSRTSDIATAIAGNKPLTSQLLQDVGIPSPSGAVVHTGSEALAAARRIGFPVVLKPLNGNHGRGVCIGITSEVDVLTCHAAARSASRTGEVLIEHHVAGKDYRILVIDKRVVAVAERVPAHVVGDGEHSIRDLVAITNADPRRGLGHEKSLTRIPLTPHTEETLARQSLSLNAIPVSGQHVPLQQMGSLGSGGTAVDRTDDIHPDNVEIARQAAMVVGLDVAGIDLVCPDISRSVRETGGAVVGVTAAPSFRMHSHPSEGHPRQVGRAVTDMLFPPGSPSRVPIVAVTGTNGKTTTTRMIAAIMRAAGHQVGMTTTDGIYVNETQIASGDMAGPGSARMVLKNPAIDFAVLETARGGIVRSGLGFDRCDVAVVTNVSSDHLGLGGAETLEDLYRIKAVVPAAVFRRGASVLNADNAWTVRMAERARGEIIYFSMDAENAVIREHVRNHGRAVVLKANGTEDMIVLLEGKEETSLLRPCEIPATSNGLIQVNIANALAAVAAAIARDVQFACIRDALRAFTTDFAQTPGRFNLLRIEGRHVLMDYGHNVGALEAVGDFVRRLNPPRSVGVIAVPGDRRDEDARAFAHLAAQIFDDIIVREDGNLRGRAPGEMAALLCGAAQEGGVPPGRIRTVPDEIDATHAAIDMAQPGDLVVTLVEQVTAVWSSISARATRSALPPRDVPGAPAAPTAAASAARKPRTPTVMEGDAR